MWHILGYIFIMALSITILVPAPGFDLVKGNIYELCQTASQIQGLILQMLKLEKNIFSLWKRHKYIW